MATNVNNKCKAFTSLEQSKKLAEILPLDSADMSWKLVSYGDEAGSRHEPSLATYNTVSFLRDRIFPKDSTIPCWSLAALLNILPNEIITNNMFECHYQIDIRKYDGGNNTTLYQIAYGNNSGLSGSWHDMINTGEKESLIDCCVQMIIKLHELKKL